VHADVVEGSGNPFDFHCNTALGSDRQTVNAWVVCFEDGFQLQQTHGLHCQLRHNQQVPTSEWK